MKEETTFFLMFSQERISFCVVQVLLCKVSRVLDSNVFNISRCTSNGDEFRIDESSKRLQVELGKPLEHLVMLSAIHTHAVILDKCFSCFAITGTFDALHFTQKIPKQATETIKVLDRVESLSVLLHFTNDVILEAVLKAPRTGGRKSEETLFLNFKQPHPSLT